MGEQIGEKGPIKVHSNLYNVIMGFLLKVSQVLFPLITFPYVSRILLADGVGKVNFAQSTVSVFTTLAMLGIPLYGIKACARVRDDKVKLATTVKELLTINTISLVIAYSILAVCVLCIDRMNSDIVLFAVMSTTIAFTAFGVEWFYQAIEQYDYITVRSVAIKAISVVVMFFIIKDRADVVQYGFILVLGTVGSNLLNIIRLHKYVSLRSASKMNLRQHIKPILTLFAFSATTTIYTSLDTVILGFLADDVQVGFFSAANKIKSLFTQVVTVASSVLLPRSAYLLEQGRRLEFESLIRSSLRLNVMIALPLMAVSFINAENIMLLLSGEAFLPAVPAMVLILPATAFVGITNVLGMQLLMPMNREKYVFYSTFVGAIVNIILCFILIPMWGAAGCALALALTECAVFVAQVIYVRRLEVNPFDCPDLLKLGLAAVLSGIGSSLAVASVENLRTSLVVSTLVFGVLYLVLLVVFREKSAMMVLKGRLE